MVELKNISKKFAAVTALDNASITVKKGEIKALLGANGSGKSTMIKVLSGLVKPDGGQIIIDGNITSISSSADARKLGIAVAYQDLSLIPQMSVLDNIMLGIEIKNKFGMIDNAKSKKLALSYIHKLKINCAPETLVQSLMPSTQSMIEIAKAMAMQPRILVLDEATASLHSDEVDTLFNVLRELKAEGISIINVTHRMEEIYRICDSCTILRGGATVSEGMVADMALGDIVYHMTGKRPDVVIQKSNGENGVDNNKEELLEVRNLKIFPQVEDVSLSVYKGEIVGIGGLDGQGQSEFLRGILADEKIASGDIVYQENVTDYKMPADAIAQDIGFISGDRSRESIFPIRTVAENIFAGATTKGHLFSYLSSKTVTEFSENAMSQYNIIAGSSSHPASSLSGGNQQKLVLARWIALSPNLLLMDDPTKGVDIGARIDIHKILKQCTAEGMSVIYISSDNSELLDISDRIYVFYEGRISDHLSGNERTEERLVAAMLGLNGLSHTQEEAQ